MTNQHQRGAPPALNRVRAGLCAALAVFTMYVPTVHADAFVAKSKADDKSQQIIDRLESLEQRMTDVAMRQTLPAQAGGQGSFNMPAPPGGAFVADDELSLDYEVKGELNGAVMVKRKGRIQVMDRGEFERFDQAAKSRARMALSTAAQAPQLNLPSPPPANNMNNAGTHPGTAAPAGRPPVPSTAAARAAKANPANAAPAAATK